MRPHGNGGVGQAHTDLGIVVDGFRGLFATLARLVEPVLLDAAELARRLLRGPLAGTGEDLREPSLGLDLPAVPLAASQLDLGLLQLALLSAFVGRSGPQHPPCGLLFVGQSLFVG